MLDPEPVLLGDIAQLGERVLCKHEVVGSIPSVSTILRDLRLLVQLRSMTGIEAAIWN